MAEDRTTLALSADGFRILDELEADGWFSTQLAAYQAAIALALAKELPIPDRKELGKLETKFNVGSLDPRIREMVQRFYKGDVSRPYEVAQLLAEAGLREMDQARKSDIRLSDALGIQASSG